MLRGQMQKPPPNDLEVHILDRRILARYFAHVDTASLAAIREMIEICAVREDAWFETDSA